MVRDWNRGQKKPRPPLDAAALEAIGLRYVERFQTTRARLLRLLSDKVRLRGWAGEGSPDLEAIADRLVDAGYVDDRAFAEARVRGLARRGMGPARARASLSAAGIQSDEQQEALQELDPLEAAIAFARRKRLGPFGPDVSDPKIRQRQFGMMARAGHSPPLARAILDARSEEDLPQPD